MVRRQPKRQPQRQLKLRKTRDRWRYARRAGVVILCALLLSICIAAHFFAYFELFPTLLSQANLVITQLFLVALTLAYGCGQSKSLKTTGSSPSQSSSFARCYVVYSVALVIARMNRHAMRELLNDAGRRLRGDYHHQ
jgi:hypothetical protein